MTTKFPKKFQALIDDAIRHLWDPNCPKPDLRPLTQWLRDQAWEDVMNGILGGYIDCQKVHGFLDDASLVEPLNEEKTTRITDPYRVNFAKGRLNALFDQSACSINALDVASKAMPPASLCMMIQHNGVSGARFHNLVVCHCAEDYLASLKHEVVWDGGALWDEDTLNFSRISQVKKKGKSAKNQHPKMTP